MVAETVSYLDVLKVVMSALWLAAQTVGLSVSTMAGRMVALMGL